MDEKKKFRCPHCGHSELETVPHRPRCPKCGQAIPRPERDVIIAAPGRRTAPAIPI
jgi:Zn finger protein HypA/HybF involved in hydrogenase expression